MYGHVERPDDDQTDRNTGRHRGSRLLSAPVALGLTVVALLGAFGIGAALLPDSVTGSGVQHNAQAASANDPAGVAGGLPVTDAPPSPPVESPLPSPGEAPPSPAASPDAPAPSPKASPKASPAAAKAPDKPQSKPAPKKRSPANVPADQESQENEVIRLVNVERGKAGCGAVKLNTKLRTAMRLHVEELGRRGGMYISHDSADGRSFVDRAKEQNYNDPGGENVARGQRNAGDVMQSWMNSSGHRENIMNCSFKAIGVGMVKGVDNSLVWGQIFGRS